MYSYTESLWKFDETTLKLLDRVEEVVKWSEKEVSERALFEKSKRGTVQVGLDGVRDVDKRVNLV